MPYKNKEDQRKFYHKWKSKPENMAKIAISNRRTLQRVKDKLTEYKLTLSCSRCPENHPSCLDFHHHGDDKETEISTAVHDGWAWGRILTEIKKCIVLCSNCHRKEHWGKKHQK